MPISPPRPKGPALNALRAFEAAARLGGFSAAAEELCVTPGAVAQHIKALEAWAGADLFERRSQGVEMTPFGAEVLHDFSDAFDRLGEAVQKLRSGASPKHIRIAALPSVAQLWLSPRLPVIRQASPDVAISVTAMEWQPNLRREPFDLSIFFDEPAEQRGAVELCRDVIFPVCAPDVAARLKTPSDLEGEIFLHDATWIDDWDRWLGAAMGDEQLDSRGPVFSLYSLAVEEAQNGAGVLIGHEALVRRHLTSGTLVDPFATRLTLDRSLSMAVASPALRNPNLDRVVQALCADNE